MAFPADAAAALASLKTAIAAAGTLKGAPVQAVAAVAATAHATRKILRADVAAIEPLLNVASPDGADPTICAAWLLAAQVDSANQANLAFAGAYVGRMVLNLTAAQTQ